MTVYNHKQISYVEAINICKNVLHDVLIPYFEKTKDSKNAHEYMIENDSLVKSGTKDFDTREIGFYLSKPYMSQPPKKSGIRIIQSLHKTTPI